MKLLQQLNTWKFTYKGIYYQINKWSTSCSPECWAYYIYIYENDKLTGKLFPEILEEFRSEYSLYNCPLIENLYWHGGCTYFERMITNGNKFIKAGCDYQHLNDRGQLYSVSRVQEDVTKTIDALITLLNEYNPSDKVSS